MNIINSETRTEPIDAVRPHPRNPREGDVGAIHESIQANGFYGSILAQRSTGHILAGNHRHQAAMQQGATQIPVTWIDVDDDHALRILLADNRTNDVAAYDDNELAMLLEELQRDTGTLAGTGYDGDDLDELLDDLGLAHDAGTDEAPEAQTDRADELREKWGTEVGQLWQIGPHRLLCGDSTSLADVERLMSGDHAEVMWSDPPYGVSYVGKTKASLTIKNDGADNLYALLTDVFAAVDSVLAPSARFYLSAPAGPQGTVFRLAVDTTGWKLHQVLVWVKSSMVLGYSDYHYRHEDILYGFKPGSGRPGRGNHEGSRWRGDNSQTTVLEYDKPARNEDHPTMKPVELVKHCLNNSARRGDIVLDPFSGSGTTLIACQQQGLNGRGLELDATYVAVILERLAGMGLTPELVE